MKLKRLIVIVVVIVLLGWLSGFWENLTRTKASGFQVEAEAAVLLDGETGQWLFEYNAQKRLSPASMSKMMTELIVLDEISSGKLDWDDRVVFSDYAADVGGAGLGIAAGKSVTVRRLFEAMAIQSANDATVALAEHVAGSETSFVARMNERAAEIGLSDQTYFANATGLSRGDLKTFEAASAKRETLMTAKDVALLARRLIELHPEVLKVTKKADTDGSGLRTTNEMLPGQRFGTKGNDGLKTGYTEKAGYCFAGTTVINGRRYITVVMGARTPEARFEETKKLLNFGETL